MQLANGTMQSAMYGRWQACVPLLAGMLICLAAADIPAAKAQESAPAVGVSSAALDQGPDSPGLASLPAFVLFGLPAGIEEGQCRDPERRLHEARLVAPQASGGAGKSTSTAKRITAGPAIDGADSVCAALALEYARDGDEIVWQRPGHEARLTPSRSYRDRDGRHCREFRLEQATKERVSRTDTRACRSANRNWVLQ